MESQQEAAGQARNPEVPPAHETPEVQARRRTLELARARARADLAAARAPAHRQMLERALEALDDQLNQLAAKASR